MQSLHVCLWGTGECTLYISTGDVTLCANYNYDKIVVTELILVMMGMYDYLNNAG